MANLCALGTILIRGGVEKGTPEVLFGANSGKFSSANINHRSMGLLVGALIETRDNYTIEMFC